MTVYNTYEIALDLKREVYNTPITLTEGDTGVIFDVTIVDNGQFVNLAGCRVLAVFAKPNGLYSQDSSVADSGCTIVDGKVHIELSISSFSPGLNTCTLQVYSGDDSDVVVTTTSFNYRVRRSIINDSTIQEDTSLPILNQLIIQVTQALALATPFTNVSASASVTENASATVTVGEDSAAFTFGLPTGVIVSDSEPAADSAAVVWVKPTGGAYAVYYKDQSNVWVGVVARGGVTSVNGATGAVTLGAADVGAVPDTRTVNSKQLDEDITLDASDVGAIPSSKLPSVITVALLAANWSSNEQTISNVGFETSGSSYIVTPAPASFTAYAESVIYADDVTVAGQMTFHCDSEPTSDISVNILKVGI